MAFIIRIWNYSLRYLQDKVIVDSWKIYIARVDSCAAVWLFSYWALLSSRFWVWVWAGVQSEPRSLKVIASLSLSEREERRRGIGYITSFDINGKVGPISDFTKLSLPSSSLSSLESGCIVQQSENSICTVDFSPFTTLAARCILLLLAQGQKSCSLVFGDEKWKACGWKCGEENNIEAIHQHHL